MTTTKPVSALTARISADLNAIFSNTDTAEVKRTRLVALDDDGHPDYIVRRAADGSFVYAGSHPYAGRNVPAPVKVAEQVYFDGKWHTENQ